MAKKITCTNDRAISVYFDYTFTPFFLVSCDGLYGTTNRVDRTDNTNTDGSTYQGMNTEERNIVITAQMCENYQGNRDILYKCFRPKTKGVLVHEENGIKRQIEYVVESIDVEEKGVVRNITISLLSGDPFFTDTDYTTEHMASWTSGFEWEHEFKEEGEEIGYRTMELIKEIENNSTTDNTGAIIRLEALAEVNTPTVRNLTTGQFITINTSMQFGDAIEICTETNKKNVYLIRGERTTSINGLIDEDSDFIQLVAGENTLQYEAVSGTEKLNVSVRFRQKYLGV